MRNLFHYFILFILFSLLISSKNSKDPIVYAKFRPVLGEWIIKGTMMNVQPFEQKVVFKEGISKHLILTESYNRDADGNWSQQFQGVRYFDPDSRQIRFEEWKKTGQFTEGVVSGKGDTLWYNYEYGGATLRDAWIPIHPDTFQFKIGYTKNGQWSKQILLDTKAIRLP